MEAEPSSPVVKLGTLYPFPRYLVGLLEGCHRHFGLGQEVAPTFCSRGRLEVLILSGALFGLSSTLYKVELKVCGHGQLRVVAASRCAWPQSSQRPSTQALSPPAVKPRTYWRMPKENKITNGMDAVM